MTIYLHLNSIGVTPGQKVVIGQKIGTVGSSGLSTAPHVHWGLYVHGVPGGSKTVDGDGILETAIGEARRRLSVLSSRISVF